MHQLVPLAHLVRHEVTDLQALAADLEYAAGPGAQAVGHAAVQAGAAHADTPMREVLGVERIHTTMTGELQATVTASQDAGVSMDGPRVAATAGIADAMAHEAVEAGAALLKGKK